MRVSIFHRRGFAMERTPGLMFACVLLLSGCGPGESEETSNQASPLQTVLATRDDNLALGSPTDAARDAAMSDDYLIERDQYALSYNNSRGSANWVSWHLSPAWKGGAQRQTTFSADTSLPDGWVTVHSSWYTNTGFDRGHLCPSDDRDGSVKDNRATFLLTNIVPQAPSSNRQTWRDLEEYCRSLINAGNELYIVAGPLGVGGRGSRGAADTIHSGQITVPAFLWKVVVVLPAGSKDVKRVSADTRVIAVNMPNEQSTRKIPWDSYRVSVDELEALTGYDFLSRVPTSVQKVIEASVDDGPTE
jgi:endonuclease G